LFVHSMFSHTGCNMARYDAYVSTNKPESDGAVQQHAIQCPTVQCCARFRCERIFYLLQTGCGGMRMRRRDDYFSMGPPDLLKMQFTHPCTAIPALLHCISPVVTPEPRMVYFTICPIRVKLKYYGILKVVILPILSR